MGIESIIVWLIVGAIAGWLAGLIVKGGGFGLLGNIVIGIIGAVGAGWLLPTLGVHLGSGIVGAIIDSMIGAVVVLVIISLIKRPWRSSFILETTAALAVVSCLMTGLSFDKKQQGRLSHEI